MPNLKSEAPSACRFVCLFYTSLILNCWLHNCLKSGDLKLKTSHLAYIFFRSLFEVSVKIDQTSLGFYWKSSCFNGFESVLIADQVWRRHNWNSPTNRLNSGAWERWIFGTKNRPYAFQGIDHLRPRHCFVGCEDHLQPAATQVLNHKQQSSVVVVNHIPRRRASDL